MPTHYKGTPQEELTLNTFIKLTRATESLETRLSHRGVYGGLTHTQFGVLETIYHIGPLCQFELGSKLLKSSGNVTMVIDNLEKQGLVRRVVHPNDRRMTQVSLTDAGRKRIAEVFPGYLAALVEEFAVLTPEEQQTLGEISRKLGLRAKISASQVGGD